MAVYIVIQEVLKLRILVVQYQGNCSCLRAALGQSFCVTEFIFITVQHCFSVFVFVFVMVLDCLICGCLSLFCE